MSQISAEKYLSDILAFYSEIEQLQKCINDAAKKAENCSDYDEYKESIESYKTL